MISNTRESDVRKEIRYAWPEQQDVKTHQGLFRIRYTVLGLQKS